MLAMIQKQPQHLNMTIRHPQKMKLGLLVFCYEERLYLPDTPLLALLSTQQTFVLQEIGEQDWVAKWLLQEP